MAAGKESLAIRPDLGKLPGMTAKQKKLSPLDQALACQRDGDLEGAEAGFRAVLEADSEQPDALVLLGILLRKTGRANEAIPFIERAIAAAQRQGRNLQPAWHVALAYAKRDSGAPEAALAIFETLLKEAPGVPEPLFLRAGMLQQLERHEEALRDYGALLKQAPNNSKIIAGIGRSLNAQGRFREAAEAFCTAVDLDPDDVDSAFHGGTLLGQRGDIVSALNYLRKARSLRPADTAIANTLIDVLMVGGGLDEAERIARDLEQKNPFDPSVLTRVAQILLVKGDMEAARDVARRALVAGPGFVAALVVLSEIDAGDRPDFLLAQIDRQLQYGTNNDQETVALNFAAARVHEKLKQGPEAFRHYAAANRRLKDQFFQMGRAYDRKKLESSIGGIIKAFGSEIFGRFKGVCSSAPIFIVGMPRSGTTLTEQILASHPNIVGAGELRKIGEIVGRLSEGGQYPEGLTAQGLENAAHDYLAHIAEIGRDAPRVTDKMPKNYMYLGLIALMFPNARIIHCRRDPMDTCLSCFAQNFGSGMAWSSDLEDLAHRYCQYRRVMAHWRAVLPDGIMLEIDYEDTVVDVAGQVRRLIDFVGLQWDDACIDYYKTERRVFTASREQVRNPIYSSSVGRWKRYGDGVTPLVEALGACGCSPDIADA